MVFKKPKKKEVIRTEQRRNFSFGQRVEIDGCSHKFLNNKEITLIGSIDVATGLILSLHFEKKAESLNGHQSNIEKMINNYGIPQMIITDNRKNFYNSAESNASTYNAVRDLGIEFITTSESNGKPHIERFWDFLHKREFQVEIKDHNYKTIEELNQNIGELMNYLNITRKSVIQNPQSNFFRQPHKEYLENYFDLEIKRKINAAAVTYNNVNYAPYENDKRIKINSSTDIKFVIGTDEKLYFRTKNKRYEAKPISTKDMTHYEKIASEKTLAIRGKRSINHIKTSFEWFLL
ncbi:hypothetical protein ACR82Z_01415 [Mycoplasma sp. 6243]|uniref:hypothetical protein n=1 Tax=Mycoplasma sp. 6243 TaxID=3440865 RepID=UPI003EBB77A4